MIFRDKYLFQAFRSRTIDIEPIQSFYMLRIIGILAAIALFEQVCLSTIFCSVCMPLFELPTSEDRIIFKH